MRLPTPVLTDKVQSGRRSRRELEQAPAGKFVFFYGYLDQKIL